MLLYQQTTLLLLLSMAQKRIRAAHLSRTSRAARDGPALDVLAKSMLSCKRGHTPMMSWLNWQNTYTLAFSVTRV